MSKLKFPDAGLIQTLGHSIHSNPDHNQMGEPCFSVSEEGCNTSTVRAWYILTTAGLMLPGYNGRKCPHGYPTSGGALAYMYDNYVRKADRFPCEPALKAMLKGTVALMLFKNIRGTRRSELDLWLTDRCTMMSYLNGEAEEVWIWGLGVYGNQAQHRARQKPKHTHKPLIF